jgi:hypothetical protein
MLMKQTKMRVNKPSLLNLSHIKMELLFMSCFGNYAMMHRVYTAHAYASPVLLPLPLNARLKLSRSAIHSAMIILLGDKKVSVHLMITIQKVTSNVQSVSRQSPDIY